MEKWSIQVKDVLSRDLFQHAVVAAGKNGLNREIKWTHILESGDMESFINGGELILDDRLRGEIRLSRRSSSLGQIKK